MDGINSKEHTFGKQVKDASLCTTQSFGEIKQGGRPEYTTGKDVGSRQPAIQQTNVPQRQREVVGEGLRAPTDKGLPTKQHVTGSTHQMATINSDKENMSMKSFGTGSFTTNTFNHYLRDSNGMKILKYI